MEQKYKVITVNTTDKEKREILDVEDFFAEDLPAATKLAKNIQLAELKQSCSVEDFEIKAEDYQDAFIDISNNVGIIQSGKENIMLVIGINNSWFYVLDNNKMDDITIFEWNDFVNEILNKEPGEKDLIEL